MTKLAPLAAYSTQTGNEFLGKVDIFGAKRRGFCLFTLKCFAPAIFQFTHGFTHDN
jgi:hypothetical protein